MNTLSNKLKAVLTVSVAAVLVLPVAAVAQSPSQGFTQRCPNPSYPGRAVAIDNRCGAEGSGGEEAEQDALKNNFCAGGTPTAMTFKQFEDLQTEVERNGNINFGDRDNPGGKHGPTTDRAPLRDLGEGKLVVLRGFVLTAKQEGAESVNCEKAFDNEQEKNLFHDIHISFVPTLQLASPQKGKKAEEAADECQGIVIEMSPHHRPPEWTFENVDKVAASHMPVRVTGQLFFDSSHVPCANGSEVRTNPKRFSLWEIHPIYEFEICTANCDGAGTWLTLERWIARR